MRILGTQRPAPRHRTLIVLPLSLWGSSFGCDLLWLLSGAPVWRTLAFYTIAGGILGALLAAIPGIVDFLSLRHPLARRVGWAHLLINSWVVSLYGVNLWLRTRTPPLVILPEALSGLSVLLVSISGWLIYSLQLGVEQRVPAVDAGRRAV
jgi:uncharacterized membrane protein